LTTNIGDKYWRQILTTNIDDKCLEIYEQYWSQILVKKVCHTYEYGDIDVLGTISLLTNSLDLLIHFWLQVAKMLKEIPRGSTFVIRLVEPLKAGFGKFLSFLLHPLVFSFLLDFFYTAPRTQLTNLREGPAGTAEAPPEILVPQPLCRAVGNAVWPSLLPSLPELPWSAPVVCLPLS